MKKIDVELTDSEYDLLLLVVRAGCGIMGKMFSLEWLADLTNKLFAKQENFIPVEVRDGMIQQIRTKQ